MPPRLNLPPVTRALLLLLLCQSLLSFIVRYRQWTSPNDVLVVPYLTLIPSMSLLYPWTFVTSTFVEANVFSLAISGLTLWHGGRYLERAWTSREFAKFVAIVAFVPNSFAFATLVFLYAMTGDVMWSYVPLPPAIYLTRPN
jgi:membrane associated rhomboid family serine protease